MVDDARHELGPGNLCLKLFDSIALDKAENKT